MGYLMTSMERKLRFSSSLLFQSLLLLSTSMLLTSGAVDKDVSMDVKHHMHDKAIGASTFDIEGHIIDCIDVYKQPTFEHPLLINHTIQMKPTYYPHKRGVNDYVVEVSHTWNLSKVCSEGSIPIQRIQGNGQSRDNPFVIPHYYHQKSGKLPREHSTIMSTQGNFYGAKASINVWNPKVEGKEEFSISQMWVVSSDELTSLEAGWSVDLTLSGDDKTRFFVMWTVDGYKTICFNLRCPGFIQTNPRTIINSYLEPVSVYDGPQYAVDVEISKDKTTGNWWVLLQGVEMGYWPKELLPSLGNGAGRIDFGGEIKNLELRGQHTSTQMGSGHFSYEGFKKASFFKNVQILDPSYTYKNPTDAIVTSESPKCYDIQVGKKKDGPWGYFFFYGGPGMSEGCI